MTDSLFTKIINGEIPSHKIYEDEHVYAFLDIAPDEEGHTLVVPKKQVDKIYDLDEETYIRLWLGAKRIAKHYEEILNKRVIFKVIGVDVAHAHIHVVPYDPSNHLSHDQHSAQKKLADKIELSQLAKKLAL